MTERVMCPKHYRMGTLRIKTINGRKYAYVHHRYNKQVYDCYLGPLDVIAEKCGVKSVKSQGVV